MRMCKYGGGWSLSSSSGSPPLACGVRGRGWRLFAPRPLQAPPRGSSGTRGSRVGRVISSSLLSPGRPPRSRAGSPSRSKGGERIWDEARAHPCGAGSGRFRISGDKCIAIRSVFIEHWELFGSQTDRIPALRRPGMSRPS